MIDNTTAVSYINNMESRSFFMQLWLWCIDHRILLSASHIPGKQNLLADKESRKKRADFEWKLNHKLFQSVVLLGGTPSVDLFTSRLNYQLKPFVSWQPDPEAMAIDAFSIDWREHNFYAFPPFALINRVLQKVDQDKSQGIIIVRMWTSQDRFPRLLNLLKNYTVVFPKEPKKLIFPSNQNSLHPIHKTLTFLACRLYEILSQQ